MSDPSTIRRGRRRVVAAGTIALVVAVSIGVGAVGAVALVPPRTVGDGQRLQTGTARVERGDLSGTTRVVGTLDFADQRSVYAQSSGILTSAPAVGSTVTLGGTLYRLDDRPTLLLRGDTPAWRALTAGMTPGPDVAQLEASLAALGLFSAAPDARFTDATTRAIRAWQKSLGLQQTGTLDLGSVVFAAGDLRVAAVEIPVGSAVGAGSAVLTVTSTGRQVQVDLPLNDQSLAAVGTKATAILPGGVSTAVTVASLAAPREKDSGSGKTTVVPVILSLDDPAPAAALQRSSVQVDFRSETKKDVLSVPVDALVSLGGTRFAVQVPRSGGRTSTVPVTTGLFAAGRVEVSGSGIRDGLEVVIPRG